MVVLLKFNSKNHTNTLCKHPLQTHENKTLHMLTDKVLFDTYLVYHNR